MAKMTMIPRVAPKARQYVGEVLDFGFHNGSSPGISARLEERFAAKFGRKFGILHANGTATMHSALLAAGVGVGDEVIVPAYTVAMTATVALYANAIPVFADVDPDTWTIDPEDVRRKITPRTRAIIPVSICGLAVKMPCSFCRPSIRPACAIRKWMAAWPARRRISARTATA